MNLLDISETWSEPDLPLHETGAFVDYIRTAKRTIAAREMAHLWSERLCRALANRANELGYPIASGNDGYFYAERFEDFEPMLSRLRHQRDKMHERILAIERLRAKRFGGA